MKRRLLKDMTDAELLAERQSLANVAGKWASNRYLRILEEQIRREEGTDKYVPLTREQSTATMLDLCARMKAKHAEKSA